MSIKACHKCVLCNSAITIAHDRTNFIVYLEFSKTRVENVMRFFNFMN